MADQLDSVLQEWERLEQRAAVHDGDVDLLEASVELETGRSGPRGAPAPELRLLVTLRSRHWYSRAWRSLIGRGARTRVLVLTPAGYRLTRAVFLASRRSRPSGRPRLVRYSASSHKNLRRTLHEMVERLRQVPREHA